MSNPFTTGPNPARSVLQEFFLPAGPCFGMAAGEVMAQDDPDIHLFIFGQLFPGLQARILEEFGSQGPGHVLGPGAIILTLPGFMAWPSPAFNR